MAYLLGRGSFWIRAAWTSSNPVGGSASCRAWHTSARLNQAGEGKKALLRAKKAERMARKSSMYEKFLAAKVKKAAQTPPIEVWRGMSIRDLSRALDQPADALLDLARNLKNVDPLRNIREPIEQEQVFREMAKLLKFRYRTVANSKERQEPEEAERNLDVVPEPVDAKRLRPRAPVVAIMGHVDHGKTTLLDHLRHSRVVDGEFGGITQHIGAFSVKLKSPSSSTSKSTADDLFSRVTFLDTPGHAAFKAMRSRGAHATDIVVLVVDACEGVLEQTEESIRMIKEAKTALVVAVNKIDKPKADVTGTFESLASAGVRVTELKGQIPAVPISALKGTNVDRLVEVLIKKAQELNLRAEYDAQVEGKVIESSIDKGLGKTATVLVTRGTLKKKDILVCGLSRAKVKVLIDDLGNRIEKAVPSQAVKVSGWKELPGAGDHVYGVNSEKRAQEVIAWREKQEKKVKDFLDAEEIQKSREEADAEYEEYRIQKLKAGVRKPKYMRHDFKVREKEVTEYSGPPKVSFVVKADVDGSLEAIMNCLDLYTSDDVVLDILDFGVGEVTENDIVLAKQFNGFIFAFNTPPITPARLKIALENGVEVKEHNIIYKLVDDLKTEIGAQLPPVEVEDVSGRARVQQEFLVNQGRRKVPVAGCKVSMGKIERGTKVRVLRGKQEIYDGTLVSLKHLKDEVNEIPQGKECGLMVASGEVRFEQGDEIISYTTRLEPQKCEWNPGF